MIPGSANYASTVRKTAQGGGPLPPGHQGPPGGWGPPGAPAGPPPAPPPVVPPGGFGPTGGAHGGAPHDVDELRKKADTWFVLSLVSMLCCCALGGVGAWLTYRAKDLLNQGKVDEAASNVQSAKIITLACIGLWFLGALGYAALAIVSVILETM